MELIGRRHILRKALTRAETALIFSGHHAGVDGAAVLRHACAVGLEGIVSKRATSLGWFSLGYLTLR